MIRKTLLILLLIAISTLVFAGFKCDCDSSNNNMESVVALGDVKEEHAEEKVSEEIPAEPKYTEEELDLLSRVVFCEAGSNWLSDEHQRAVASVVLNRVNDSRFPSTIKDVVYQRGQYGCVRNGMINKAPNQRAIDNAKYVLENGVTIPTNIVWQAQFRQGNGLWKYIEGHYFCY